MGLCEMFLSVDFKRAKDGQKGWEFSIICCRWWSWPAKCTSGIEELDCMVPVSIRKPRTEHKKGKLEESDKLVLVHVKDPVRLPKHSPSFG